MAHARLRSETQIPEVQGIGLPVAPDRRLYLREAVFLTTIVGFIPSFVG